MSKRVLFVDFARSYAICLALFDHSMNDFGIWENYTFNEYAAVKVFTTSATPTFLFLFGMMLELIYLKRLKKNGLASIKPQLLKRSFQCYLGFFLTAVAGFIGGFLTLKRTFATTFFAANTHYGNILKVYCVLIVLAIPLLLFRRKFGLWPLIILSMLIWLIYPLSSQIQIVNGNIEIFFSSMLGIGKAGGPSVLHSFTIVCIGMLSASFVNYDSKWKFTKNNFVLLILIMGILLSIGSFVPWETLKENYFSNTYRQANHPIYYAVAISLALIHIILFSIIIPLGTMMKNWHKKLLVFGRNSLSAFTIGNIILNLFLPYTSKNEFTLLAPILFIIFVYILLFFYERWELRRKNKLLLKTSK